MSTDQAAAATKSVPIYHQKWLVVLAVLFFWPVGLILLWTSPATRMSGRITWTVLVALGTIMWLAVVGVFMGAAVSTLAPTRVTPAASTPQTISPDAPTRPASPAAPAAAKAPNLELLDSATETGDFGIRSVVGTIRNNTSRTYGYVQVEINLYDDSGAQVGSTLANANNLEPGGSWKFSAPIIEDSATKFKVAGITGF